MRPIGLKIARIANSRGVRIPAPTPVVIVSMTALIELLQTVTVCPLTTQFHPS